MEKFPYSYQQLLKIILEYFATCTSRRSDDDDNDDTEPAASIYQWALLEWP